LPTLIACPTAWRIWAWMAALKGGGELAVELVVDAVDAELVE
jgi:hypothetical protein